MQLCGFWGFGWHEKCDFCGKPREVLFQKLFTPSYSFPVSFKSFFWPEMQRKGREGVEIDNKCTPNIFLQRQPGQEVEGPPRLGLQLVGQRLRRHLRHRPRRRRPRHQRRHRHPQVIPSHEWVNCIFFKKKWSSFHACPLTCHGNFRNIFKIGNSILIFCFPDHESFPNTVYFDFFKIFDSIFIFRLSWPWEFFRNIFSQNLFSHTLSPPPPTWNDWWEQKSRKKKSPKPWRETFANLLARERKSFFFFLKSRKKEQRKYKREKERRRERKERRKTGKRGYCQILSLPGDGDGGSFWVEEKKGLGTAPIFSPRTLLSWVFILPFFGTWLAKERLFSSSTFFFGGIFSEKMEYGRDPSGRQI